MPGQYAEYKAQVNNFRAMMKTLSPRTQAAIRDRLTDLLSSGEHKLFSVVLLAAGVEGYDLDQTVAGAVRIYQVALTGWAKADHTPLVEAICEGTLGACGLPRALRGHVSLGGPNPTPARVSLDAMLLGLGLGEQWLLGLALGEQ